jgi:hypothetical protein
MSSFVNNHASTSRSPDLSRTPALGSSRTFSVQLPRSEQLEYSPGCNTHSPLSQSHAQNDVNRELIVTSLDCRVSRQPTLQPAYNPTFNTFPPPAISHQPNTYYSHHVPVDDHLLNSPSIPHRPGPSSTTGQHVSSHNHLGSYQLSSSLSSRHVAINSNSQRLTTSTPVFNNISDLAAHYGIPQFLPRAPRTAPSRPEPGESSSSTLPVEPFASTSPDFTDLCTNYLTMLSQTPDNNATDVRVEDTAQSTASPSDAEAIKTLMDVFSGELYSPATLAWLTQHPATPDLTMSNDLNEYLTSPLMDSPFDELLTTPAFGSADSANILTSPLLDDFGGDSYGELPSLFGDFSSMYAPSKTAQPHNLSQPNFDDMYQISPETPMLDTPATPPLDSPAYHPSQRKTNVNGTRKNITYRRSHSAAEVRDSVSDLSQGCSCCLC